MNKTRTENVAKNVVLSSIFQIIAYIIGFVSRTIFIKILGGELKGIIEISIEETDLKHNIVEVKKVKNCPKTYPRK